MAAGPICSSLRVLANKSLDGAYKAGLCGPMRSIPPLAAVRVFEAAARHGNFTRAAAELGMTQAAVSYQIKLLEERLGASLFARGGRGLALTDAGRRLAPQVTGAFELLDDAFAAVRKETEAVLTISAPTSFAANWLAGRLGAFQLTRPGLAVRLAVSDETIDFSGNEADVAVRSGVPPWPGLRHEFLMRFPFAAFASPAMLARHPPVAGPDDVLRLPRLSSEDVWWRIWTEAAGGAPIAAEPAGGVQFTSQVLEGNAAINGHGVALLSPMMWEPQIASGQLVQVLPTIAFWRTSFWLVYPEGKRHLAKVRAFHDWLLAEVRATLADDPHGMLVPPGEVC